MRYPEALILPALILGLALHDRGWTAEEIAAATTPKAPAIQNIRKLTFAGTKNGEGYFSPDGKQIIFQAVRDDSLENPFYQIYTMPLDAGTTERISNGNGRTTCSFFHPKNGRRIFASSHLDPKARTLQEEEFKKLKDGPGRRYSWAFDPHMDIFESKPGEDDLTRLTQAEGYDAECGYSPDGSKIVFCSFRDGDGEIYTMDADGSNQTRLTSVKGYDGGPFFSPDGKQIVWRRFALDDKTAEVWVMNADGSDQRQVTRIGAMAWAPYYHPSGEWVCFACNHDDVAFDLYLIRPDGTGLCRLTDSAGFDGLPVFAPNGRHLLWTSTRDGDGSHLYYGEVRLPGIPFESSAPKESGRGHAGAEDLKATYDKLLAFSSKDTPPAEAERSAARFIADAFASLKMRPASTLPAEMEPVSEDFIRWPKGPKQAIRIAGLLHPLRDVKGVEGTAGQGDSKQPKSRWLLVTAFFPDGQSEGPSRSTASGATALLEVARQMSEVARFKGLPLGICFIATSARQLLIEENLDSQKWLEGVVSSENVAAAVHLDSLNGHGREVLLSASGSISGWRSLAEPLAAAHPSLRVKLTDERTSEDDDHSRSDPVARRFQILKKGFAERKIPFLTISDAQQGHSKEVEKFSLDAFALRTDLALGAAYRLAGRLLEVGHSSKDLLYFRNARRPYLGTKPEYKGDGTGVILSSVRDDTPAAHAGLKAKDKVIGLGGKEIKDVESYLEALERLKVGEKTEIVVLREGQKLQFPITPDAR